MQSGAKRFLIVAGILVAIPAIGFGAYVGYESWDRSVRERHDRAAYDRARERDKERLDAVLAAHKSIVPDGSQAPCSRKIRTEDSMGQTKIAHDERVSWIWLTSNTQGNGATASRYNDELRAKAQRDRKASFDEVVKSVDASFVWDDELTVVYDTVDEAQAVADRLHAGGFARGKAWLYSWKEKRVICASAFDTSLTGTVNTTRRVRSDGTVLSDDFRGRASDALHQQASVQAARDLVTLPPR